MKDTNFKGKKNNLYYHSILNKNRFYMNIRLCNYYPGILSNNNSLILFKNQRKYYHISNIRAINRIGPHNEEILSVIIGSILGDAYANKRSGEGVSICYRQSIRHKEYLF